MVIQAGAIVDVELKGAVLAVETSAVNRFTEEQCGKEEISYFPFVDRAQVASQKIVCEVKSSQWPLTGVSLTSGLNRNSSMSIERFLGRASLRTLNFPVCCHSLL